MGLEHLLQLFLVQVLYFKEKDVCQWLYEAMCKALSSLQAETQIYQMSKGKETRVLFDIEQ